MLRIMCFCLFISFSAPVLAQNPLGQLGYGVYRGIINLVTSPVRAIKISKFRKRYKKLTEAHQGQTAYQCKLGFEVLALNKHQFVPTQENSLTFRNHDDFVYPIKNPLGFCWGHAKVTQKFNRLAHFRPDLKIKHKPGSRKWKKHYKRIVKDIALKNKPRIIEGFANLHEFSSDPYIEKRLGKAVGRNWADLAMNIRGLKTGLKKQNTKEERLKILEQLKTRLEKNQIPTVTMHYLGENFTETHIVVIWKDLGKDENGYHKFCARDNNSEYATNVSCENYLLVNEDFDGPIKYMQKKYVDLEGLLFDVGVILDYSEDSDTAQQIENMNKFCQEKESLINSEL